MSAPDRQTRSAQIDRAVATFGVLFGGIARSGRPQLVAAARLVAADYADARGFDPDRVV